MRAELCDVALFGSIERFGDMAIHAVIDLARTFSRAELERALGATLGAFPVLGRRYATRFWRDRWEEVTEPLDRAVHVVDAPGDLEAETDRWVRRSLDVTRERPVRLVSLGRAGGRSRLVFSIMHVAVDGAGVAAVAHVLGSHLYGALPAARVDPRRSVGAVLEGLGWRHAPRLARDLVAVQLLPLRVRRAARRERPYPSRAAGEASWRHVTISRDEVERLRARCAALGASLNDALVAALARAAATRTRQGPIAAMYTMDLRRYSGEPRLTAANTSTILSLVVPRAETESFEAATRAVSALARQHRRGLAGAAMLLSAEALAAGLPHAWTRRLLRTVQRILVDPILDRGLVFTNVGRVDAGLEAFGGDVEQLRFVGPHVRGVKAPLVVALGFRGEIVLQLFAGPDVAPEALDELESELRAALELS